MTFKAGDIVRYGSGITALARLRSPHHHGWLADQCMGGITFCSLIRHADESDLKEWQRCAWYRKEAPSPHLKPRISFVGGRWQAAWDPVPRALPERVHAIRAGWVSKAVDYCYRMNTK